MHGGWRWTWEVGHWAWNVKSTIREAELPRHKHGRLGHTVGNLPLPSFTFARCIDSIFSYLEHISYLEHSLTITGFQTPKTSGCSPMAFWGWLMQLKDARINVCQKPSIKMTSAKTSETQNFHLTLLQGTIFFYRWGSVRGGAESKMSGKNHENSRV